MTIYLVKWCVGSGNPICSKYFAKKDAAEAFVLKLDDAIKIAHAKFNYGPVLSEVQVEV